MQSSQKLESREQLVSLCHMGPQGIMNCAGFIKIDGMVGDSDVEVLDRYYTKYFFTRTINIETRINFPKDKKQPYYSDLLNISPGRDNSQGRAYL